MSEKAIKQVEKKFKMTLDDVLEDITATFGIATTEGTKYPKFILEIIEAAGKPETGK